jgi:hypothetical protein
MLIHDIVGSIFLCYRVLLVVGRVTQVPEWDVRVDVQMAIGQNMSDSYTQSGSINPWTA